MLFILAAKKLVIVAGKKRLQNFIKIIIWFVVGYMKQEAINEYE